MRCIKLRKDLKLQRPNRCVVEDYQTDTYRAVYTVKFADSIYVLHAFQKRSKKRRATPKPDIDLIKRRLKAAEQHYKSRGERTLK